MRAIRCVNAKIKIKRKNYRPFAGRAVARMLDITTGEVIAITPDRHEAFKAAREDHAVRVAEARKLDLKPTRTASGLPTVHIRMALRRNELVRLAAHRRGYGIDLGDVGNWAWVMADALAFGPQGADYFTFVDLAAKIGIARRASLQRGKTTDRSQVAPWPECWT